MQQHLTIKEIAQNALDYHEAGLLGAQLSQEELANEGVACKYVYMDGKHRCAIGASFNPTFIEACRVNYEMNTNLTITGFAGGKGLVLIVSNMGAAAVLQDLHDNWARIVQRKGNDESASHAERTFLAFARKLVAEN